MRILLAPHEICGQMQLLARTFRELGHDALAVAYNQDPRGYPADVCMGWHRDTSKLRRAADSLRCFVKYHRGYDVLHMFYGRTFLPRLLDLPILSRQPSRLFVHFRGVEILNGDYFEYQRARLLSETSTAPSLQRNHQRKRLDTWRKHADAMFVSEPDLLRIVPEARLVQQAIDLTQWDPVFVTTDRHRPLRIVHPPSSRWKKGTDYVVQAVEELRRRGHLVELVLVEHLPHAQVKEVYASADIAVDQLLVGWHGNVSIEFMSLGKPVVCYIDPELRHHRPDLPIVSATPADLTTVLEELVLNSTRRRSLGELGRAYVEKRHDVRSICQDLLELYAEANASIDDGRARTRA